MYSLVRTVLTSVCSYQAPLGEQCIFRTNIEDSFQSEVDILVSSRCVISNFSYFIIYYVREDRRRLGCDMGNKHFEGNCYLRVYGTREVEAAVFSETLVSFSILHRATSHKIFISVCEKVESHIMFILYVQRPIAMHVNTCSRARTNRTMGATIPACILLDTENIETCLD